MTEEDVNKYIDEWFRESARLAEVKSVTAQFFAWTVSMKGIFQRIWQDGYDTGHDIGYKLGSKQKTSAILKKLTKEN